MISIIFNSASKKMGSLFDFAIQLPFHLIPLLQEEREFYTRAEIERFAYWSIIR